MIIKFFVRLIGYVLVLALFCAVGMLAAAGYWLPVKDKPGNAAAIVVLGGSATRAAYGAELYAEGLAPKVYVSRAARTREEQLLDAQGVAWPREENVYAEVLKARGVPEQAIVFYGRDCASTLQEARAAAELLGPVPGTLLVVTSPSHQRRAKMIFERALPDRQILVLGTPYDPLPHAWWTDREATAQVFSEFGKIVYLTLGGRFLESAPVPDAQEGERLEDII